MHRAIVPALLFGLLASIPTLSGCSAPSSVSRSHGVGYANGAPSQRPKRLVLADAPPETVEVEARSNGVISQCLGVLVAPRVALTAGHCVIDRDAAKVRLANPSEDENADGDRTSADVAVQRIWFDPRMPKSKTVDPRSADVAVLFLEKPIPLPSYPSFARKPATGPIFGTGLHREGDSVSTASITLLPSVGPTSRYYVSEAYARAGDSGGPVYYVGPNGKRIVVAVVAGGSPGREVLTRVDLVYDTIDRAIAIGNAERAARLRRAKAAIP